MFKRRLKNIIFIDSAGNKEVHPVDEKGLLIEGIIKAKKKGAKTRTPILNLFPMAQMNHNAVHYNYPAQPTYPILANQVQPQVQSSCPQLLVSPPSPLQVESEQPEQKLYPSQAESIPIDFLFSSEDEDINNNNLCKSSIDTSVPDFFSDFLEINSFLDL